MYKNVNGKLKHTIDQIIDVVENQMDRGDLEDRGTDKLISDFVGHVEFGDICCPTVVYEDKHGKLWLERDDSELGDEWVFVLPLYLYDVYYQNQWRRD